MKGQDCNYHCFVYHSGKQAFSISFLPYCLVDQEKLIALFAYKKTRSHFFKSTAFHGKSERRDKKKRE